MAALGEKKKEKKEKVVRRSHTNMMKTSISNKKAVNRMWYVAPTCPLFLKKIDKKKPIPKHLTKRPMRANRVIGNHTMRTLASQAGALVSKTLDREAKLLRTGGEGEETKYPILPAFTKQAMMLFEQQIVAYCQLCFENALIVKDGQLNKESGKTLHSKVTARNMNVAVESANDLVAAFTSLGPGCVTPMISDVKTTVRKEKKKAKPTSSEGN